MAKGHRTQIKKERNEEFRDKRPQAHHKFARVSDSKARIVLEQIKGKNVGQALGILRYSPRYASYLIEKVLKSAIANAENNLDMDVSRLFIEDVYANQAPTMKRIKARAQGRAFRINKRTSHISIFLSER